MTPQADPNTPSHMHRLMKTAALSQRPDMHPDRYDAVATETEILRAVGWDNPQQFFAKPPAPGTQQPPAPDPKIMTTLAIAQQRSQDDAANRAVKIADIQSRERQTAAKLDADRQNKVLDITHSLAVHPGSLAAVQNETGQA